jgi:4-amino-4-deoxy-L-arabinose transferase-like glycosyltransferase
VTSSRATRLILLVLWFAFYASFTLFAPPLLDDADSVHAEVAREILLRHDWTTLYANGIRYLEKAPVLYWSMAASFKLFGVSAAAARLPLALAVLALALTLESFARRATASTRAGLYAGLVTLSSFGIFIFSRITIPDVVVCLWLTLAVFLFWLSEEYLRPPLLLCWLFAATCALDVLTKGLIGIVFPLAIVSAYMLLTRGPRKTLARLRLLHPLSSILVFFLIATPWHILAGLANPTQGHPGDVAFLHGHWSVPLPTDGNVHGWFWFYFVNEQILRYLNLRVPRDYDTVPLFLFYGLLFIWLMPWSAYLVSAIARGLRSAPWRAIRARTLTPDGRTNLLLLLWAAIPLLFFSLSTRQEYYVLPAIPALILLIAGWLHHDEIRLTHAQPSATRHRIATTLFILGTLAAAASLFFVLHAKTPTGTTDLADLLQQNPGDYALSFGHFLDLNAQAMGMFRTPLLITALSLFFATLANLLLRRRAHPHAANLALAAGAFGFLLAAHLGLQTFAPVLSSQQLAAAIAPHLHPDDLIVLHGEYEAGSTLGFYLKRNDLHIWDGRSSNLWYGSFFPDAPKIFETNATIAAKWLSPQRIFLWQDPNDHERPLPPLPGPVYPLAKSGGKLLLSNHPVN